MKKFISLFLLVALVFVGCSKDPEVVNPNIIGNTYSEFMGYQVFSLAGNSTKNKAYIFTSSTKFVLIWYVDNTYMPSFLSLPKYELTSKTEETYKLNFPDFTFGDDIVYKYSFSSDADLVSNADEAMNKVDKSSELGIFLNSVK